MAEKNQKNNVLWHKFFNSNFNIHEVLLTQSHPLLFTIVYEHFHATTELSSCN